MSEPLFELCSPRRLYVRTFGCQMNEYDSLQVLRQLTAQGYEVVEDMELADVIFLNTCSVRAKAEQKVHSFLGSLRRLKQANPDLKIIAGGCVAQQLGQKLLNRFDHLDMVIGTRAVNSVGKLLKQLIDKGSRGVFLGDEGNIDSCFDFGGLSSSPGVTASVTIMQGCNNHCAYCIVPSVRGAERSRRPEDILEEIRLLERAGVREVLLLGQNVNSYGRGLEEEINFSGLLRRIASQTGLARIRFTTSHPKDLTEDLMDCFTQLGQLCKFLHLPVQAGANGVLARMKRRYTREAYLEKVALLRRICPDIALSSDVIVGFPGETEEDFTKTMELIEEVRFDNIFSFCYSDRPNTRASGFEDKVEAHISARRLAQLQGRQAEISFAKNLLEVGKTREVLVEGASKASNGQMSGRTSQNRIVNFEAPQSSTGKIVEVKILEAYAHSLRGELIRGKTRDGDDGGLF